MAFFHHFSFFLFLSTSVIPEFTILKIFLLKNAGSILVFGIEKAISQNYKASLNCKTHEAFDINYLITNNNIDYSITLHFRV